MACVNCFNEANPGLGCYYNPRALDDACDKHVMENAAFWKREIDKLSEDDKRKYPEFAAENQIFFDGWNSEARRRGLVSC